MGRAVTSLALIRDTFGSASYPMPDESFEITHDGRVISHVGLFWRTITTTAGPLPVGGVGLVCTHPEWRRLGLASTLLRAAWRRSRLHGREHLACFAGNPALYEGLGFIRVPEVEHFMVTAGRSESQGAPLLPVVTDTNGSW